MSIHGSNEAEASPERLAASIETAFDAAEINYERHTHNDLPLFAITFGGGDFVFNDVTVLVFVDEDGESVALRTNRIACVPPDKHATMLWACNSMNNNYRWCRYFLDDDNELICQLDAEVGANGGALVQELVGRVVFLIDETYPEFMKSLWA